jgi:hypothetical protein
MSVTDKGKSSDSLPPAGKDKRRFLSAEKKYQIFLKHSGQRLQLESSCAVRDCTPPTWPGSSAR